MQFYSRWYDPIGIRYFSQNIIRRVCESWTSRHVRSNWCWLSCKVNTVQPPPTHVPLFSKKKFTLFTENEIPNHFVNVCTEIMHIFKGNLAAIVIMLLKSFISSDQTIQLFKLTNINFVYCDEQDTVFLFLKRDFGFYKNKFV